MLMSKRCDDHQLIINCTSSLVIPPKDKPWTDSLESARGLSFGMPGGGIEPPTRGFSALKI
jgi:hypothetical protein